MGARGVKPVPTELRVMRGTHRADRHGSLEDEPRGEKLTTVPEPPASLGEEGLAKWNEWSLRLADLRLLESRFLDALEMYCRAWDRLAFYEDVLEKQTEFFMAQSGYVGRHPAANGAKEARDEIRRYQIEFGLTPSSSTGVKVASAAKRGVPNRQKDVG